MSNNAPYQAMIILGGPTGVGITVTTRFLMIDLSDNTNWPHSATDKIILMGIRYNVMVRTASKAWVVALTLVKENDGTDGSVDVIDGFFTILNSIPTSENVWMPPGLDLNLLDDDTVENAVTNFSIDNNAVYKNDATFDSPAGGSKTISPGDLLLECTEAEDEGTLVGTVSVLYRTE